MAIALEQPSANAQEPAESGTYESAYPDLTARYRLTKKWGHVQVSGFGALLRFRGDSTGVEDIPLYGANISSKIKLFKKAVRFGLIAV